ncbi:MAG: bis(5'-nucleosyl)-tetraphosphatase (symmetrical) YqeK [Eubacteriaceae bacterium]|nr:bis(5'-nucleosyl)-tetraphosphatase (symmetrical) YqeK [Eubacteriaceae bacterium]
MKTDRIKKKLKASLPEKRYIHSLGVADTSKALALRLGEDPEKAYLAGLLHDCAKGMSHEEMLSYARERHWEPDEVTLGALQILHAPVSALMAREEYGVTDPDVLDAIRYHTTGRAHMSMLERIVFASDLIEPSRDFDGVEDLRRLAREDFGSCVIACIDSSIRTVMDRGGLIHPDAVFARNDLIAQRGGK